MIEAAPPQICTQIADLVAVVRGDALNLAMIHTDFLADFLADFPVDISEL